MATFHDLAVELRGINKRLQPTLIEAVGECGELVASTARDYCTPGMSPYDSMVFKSKPPGSTGAPFDTGMMRDTIQSTVADRGRGKVAAVIYTEAEQASFVHEGTSKMQPRPFMTDAMKAREPECTKIIGEAVADLFRGKR